MVSPKGAEAVVVGAAVVAVAVAVVPADLQVEALAGRRPPRVREVRP